MYPRAYHFIMLADYVIGAFFAFLILGLGVSAFAIGGGLVKGYEMRAIGSAYTMVLSGLEAEARELRADYCASADPLAAAQADCATQNAAAPASHA